MTSSAGNAAIPTVSTSGMPHLSCAPAGPPPSLPYNVAAPYAPAQAVHAYHMPTTSSKTSTNGAGITHRVKSGTADVLSRPVEDGSTILLSGLPSSQSETQLRSLLRRYGAVIYLEIHPDSRNPGKCKGSARARYQTSSEALKAVRALDGATLGNRKICVKQVKDATAASSVSSGGSTTTRHESKRGEMDRKKASATAPPLSKNDSSKSAHSKPLSSSAPPKLSSVERPARNRGSTGSGSTSSAGPLVVNGATYSRRPSHDDSDGSDDSSEEDDLENEDESSDDEDDEHSADYLPFEMLTIFEFLSLQSVEPRHN
ncbi:hypothetical protein A1O1_05534 [Capronia coronata CBS 617.96]|uniref:RRM domain-containing protein n=1 Tax=Capronia coronata CBS 617.96 TaxID=1182541 RepID=W9Z267_9EURO|nr:uncharacterized protein A1O1_05534 [Capronia coronata CBS 617.96]EXJ88604.1 hypothetical protein A1O1_05534 [Capronia coronata CBS 617.96]